MKADQIKDARRLIGMRQILLAQAAGIDNSRMSQIECGLRKANPEELKRIETALMREIATQQARLDDLLKAFAAA